MRWATRTARPGPRGSELADAVRHGEFARRWHRWRRPAKSRRPKPPRPDRCRCRNPRLPREPRRPTPETRATLPGNGAETACNGRPVWRNDRQRARVTPDSHKCRQITGNFEYLVNQHFTAFGQGERACALTLSESLGWRTS